MIATDTSLLVAYLKSGKGPDVERLHTAIIGGNLKLPPVVVTEILSDPSPSRSLAAIISKIEVLSTDEGFWERAGATRSKLITLGLKTKIADALIAQSCIDHNIALLSRDGDFQRFAKHCGLRLA
jgi:hypothetical protein